MFHRVLQKEETILLLDIAETASNEHSFEMFCLVRLCFDCWCFSLKGSQSECRQVLIILKFHSTASKQMVLFMFQIIFLSVCTVVTATCGNSRATFEGKIILHLFSRGKSFQKPGGILRGMSEQIHAEISECIPREISVGNSGGTPRKSLKNPSVSFQIKVRKIFERFSARKSLEKFLRKFLDQALAIFLEKSV